MAKITKHGGATYDKESPLRKIQRAEIGPAMVTAVGNHGVPEVTATTKTEGTSEATTKTPAKSQAKKK